MFALGNTTFACGVRSACERSFEEASMRRKLEEACWRRRHAHCHRWRWRSGHASGTQTEPQVEPATSAGVILPETGQSCCYARYSCGNNCNVVVKLVQECRFFKSILLPFYENSSPGTTRFLGKRTATIERSR